MVSRGLQTAVIGPPRGLVDVVVFAGALGDLRVHIDVKS